MTALDTRVAGERRPSAAGPRTGPWAALRRQPPWLARAVFTSTLIVIGLLSLVYLLTRLRGLFILVLISFFLSCALEAPVNRLARRGWRRSTATAAVFVAALTVVATFVWLMGQLVVRQATSLIDQLPAYSRDAANLLDERFHTHLSYEDVTAQLTGPNSLVARFGGQFAGNVVGVSTSVLGLLFQTLAVALFTYYLTVDGPRLRHWLCTFLPADRQRELHAALRHRDRPDLGLLQLPHRAGDAVDHRALAVLPVRGSAQRSSPRALGRGDLAVHPDDRHLHRGVPADSRRVDPGPPHRRSWWWPSSSSTSRSRTT